jgi:signal peptidase II
VTQKFIVKFKHVVFIVFIVLLLDQLLKIYIKTHYFAGQETRLLGLSWARITFIENEGMAWGLSFGGKWGKLALTLFRLVACIWGFWFIKSLLTKKHHNGLILCASLILGGALGNLIDSIFYGMVFSNSPYHGNMVAHTTAWGKGYGELFYGKVVDMLYFPLAQGTWPKWVPMVGNTEFLFFRPIFNLADFAISFGVISILVFQRRILR